MKHAKHHHRTKSILSFNYSHSVAPDIKVKKGKRASIDVHDSAYAVYPGFRHVTYI